MLVLLYPISFSSNFSSTYVFGENVRSGLVVVVGLFVVVVVVLLLLLLLLLLLCLFVCCCCFSPILIVTFSYQVNLLPSHCNLYIFLLAE